MKKNFFSFFLFLGIVLFGFLFLFFSKSHFYCHKSKMKKKIIQTLSREIKEEVGVVVDFNMIYVRSGSFVRVDKASVISVLFLCKWKKGKAKALEDSIDIAWIKETELLKYDFAPGVKKSLKESFKLIQ